MPAIAVLRKRGDFLAAARSRRVSTASFMLQARERGPHDATPGADPQGVRVGFTCSKKVGNAVARNRAKRRLRAIARAVLPEAGRAGWDYVLIGRAGATATRDHAAMLEDLRGALRQVHLGPQKQSAS